MKIYNWDYRGCDVVEIEDEPVLFILPAGFMWQWKANSRYPIDLFDIHGKYYGPSRHSFIDIPTESRVFIAPSYKKAYKEGYSITFSKYGGR